MMARPALKLIDGRLHTRILAQYVRRENPFLSRPRVSPAVAFCWGTAVGLLIAGLIAMWVTG